MSMQQERICGLDQTEFLQAIEAFHGFVAPGLVVGGFMVDWALEQIGPGVEADAIVETSHCLPDAVQIFTPCTIGNGWLRVLEWGKFALTLYDRKSFLGCRVWLDLHKARSYPTAYQWFMGKVPKEDLPKELVVSTFLDAGRKILSSLPVDVDRFHGRKKKGDTGVCLTCGEAFPIKQGKICLACQGKSYYGLCEPSGD